MKEMSWFLLGHSRSRKSLSPPPPPALPPPPPPPYIQESGGESKISPSIILIVAVVAVVVFISGLLHLLIRFLLRPVIREQEEIDGVTALQGQLQQLFRLHDGGIDQTYIDALPVFPYKAIIGLKDPFDCAVCLCEFDPDDKLRLLPDCSHAFHLDCIDTWLLSHSTCPLCRRSLLPELPNGGAVIFVLESGSESSREIGSERCEIGPNPQLGDEVFGAPIDELVNHNLGEKEEQKINGNPVIAEEKVVAVKLGKFRNVEPNSGEGSSSSNLDRRRCFSMGSFEYVMDERSSLQVVIKPTKIKPRARNPSRVGGGGAMSECDCHSRREGFRVFGSAREDTKGSFSFKFGLCKVDEGRSNKVACGSARTSLSETDLEKSGGSLQGIDGEVGLSSATSSRRVEATPSFARRTMMWIAGRPQNRVVSHV